MSDPQTNPALQPDTLRQVPPAAQSFSTARLERVEAIVRQGLDAVYPAAVLLVARNGGVVLHRAYGYLDPETRRRPTQNNSLFDLASVTKLFTTTAFMALVRAGIAPLDAAGLETPIVQVLPEFEGQHTIGSNQDPVTQNVVPADPAFAGKTVDTREITFRHLLTHTSGLAAWQGLFRLYDDSERPIPLPHQVPAERRAQRIAAIRNQYGFAYPPGKRLVYSDLGLILLGEAVARLFGLPLHESVRQLVLDPLGLARTTYNPLAPSSRAAGSRAAGNPPADIVPTEHCAWRDRRCIGEVHDENAAGLGGVAGHAGLFSTAWEVAVLGQTYLSQGRYGRADILSAELVEQMTRCQVDWDDRPRGLGWMLRSQSGSSSGKWFGPRSYGHTGYTGTSLWIDPDRALIVVLLTNRVYNGRDPTGIVRLRPALHDAVIEALI